MLDNGIQCDSMQSDTDVQLESDLSCESTTESDYIEEMLCDEIDYNRKNVKYSSMQLK
jgi:hypothetical protein